MTFGRAICAASLCASVLVAQGCKFDEGVQPARGCGTDCPPGMCYLGFCLAETGTVQPGIGAAGQGTGGGTAAASGSAGQVGPAGAGGAAGQGGGASGGGAGGSGASGAGGVGGDAGTGAAGQGGGASGSGGGEPPPECEPTGAEACNGTDDDCDGTVDEGTTVPCYPDGTVGCTATEGGEYECSGLCAPGVRSCVNGVLGACTGYTGPAAEMCGGGDGEAADESCDGAVDDGCPCSGDEQQSCYNGPIGTRGVGRCRAGTQTCENGLWGACQGSIVPRFETCLNQGTDDDCDGQVDDVFGAGLSCTVDSNMGLCRIGRWTCVSGLLLCVTPTPVPEARCDGRDEDCDGRVDETFAFATDRNNCGACGRTCSSSQVCCNGSCVTLDSVQHCGACGRSCGAEQRCCGGRCVTITTDEANCGACGRECGSDESCCASQCVTTDEEPNCGGCGITCGSGDCCGSQCVDTATDEANCGGCGVPCAGTCCGGQCVDTATDEANCGGCGIPCTGGTCCGGACVDTTSSNDHCGGCGLGCGEPCTCVASQCVDAGGVLCL